MSDYILAIDQGTTSTRSIVFDKSYSAKGFGQQEFAQHFPRSGWVEHDPEDLWRTTVETARYAIAAASVGAQEIAAIGITNQRETTILWDRRTGKAIYNALVWQDRRTADACARLRAEGASDLIASRTGLLIDAYFSASKIAWILDHVSGAREAADAGHLAFGTVDSWLVYRLTGGQRHVTDITNAARTMLCDIGLGQWDDELLRCFNIPRSILPEILDNIDDFGVAQRDILGATVPIRGMAGDQHASLVGQACFEPGRMKATYGTGCFALLNTGSDRVVSKNRLLTTVGYKIGRQMTYALEGSIFIAGAAVQWLRDGLGIIGSADQTADLAQQADLEQQLYLVPAFTGLGAPWWDPSARASLFGMTRNSGPAELARAALDSICLQTHDLMQAMRSDWPDASISLLRVDGGVSKNAWAMQRLSDIVGLTVQRSSSSEVTALGAAWLAGHGAGCWPGPEQFAAEREIGQGFHPYVDADQNFQLVRGWKAAVRATIQFASQVA